MTSGERIPAAVLGATGAVGQRIVALLSGHPRFRPAELLASPASAGSPYGEAAGWILDVPLPEEAARTPVEAVGEAVPDADLVFSALPSEVAGPVEEEYADAGKLVVTNARDHRMDPDVPLVVPEVNPDHMALLEGQGRREGGGIVANPNCTTIGLVMALAPLAASFDLRDVQVVTMQAISGGGYDGVPGLEIQDNVVPHIPGEEEKLGREPHKILGSLEHGRDGAGPRVARAGFRLSAQCNRVSVVDGHLQSVSVRFGPDRRPADLEEIREAWRAFRGEPQELGLPTAPDRPIQYLAGDRAPQPRLHRTAGNGMTVSVGRLRPCEVLDVRFVTLSHNTLRGAAGGAVLVAELADARRGAGAGR